MLCDVSGTIIKQVKANNLFNKIWNKGLLLSINNVVYIGFTDTNSKWNLYSYSFISGTLWNVGLGSSNGCLS